MNKLFFTLLLLIPVLLIGQDIDRNLISDRLWEQVESGRNTEYDIYVRLSDRIDPLALKAKYDREGWSIKERTYDIITRLQEQAEVSQKDILKSVKSYRGVREGSIQPFWIVNVVFMQVDQDALSLLSRRDDIDLIDLNAPLMLSSIDSEEKATGVPDGAEPGLYAINAPAMWKLGYSGYGTKAFVNDTGADPTHPSYDYKWVGAYESDQLGWFEFSGNNSYPRDCGNHGTHVLGTMVGLDRSTNDTVGVAFGAQWMGSPALCGFGTSSNIAAFQYSLDPDEDPTTTSDMPDVINNSWYDPSINDDCESIYVDVLNAMEASGKIAPIFSAGNEGPGDQTITPPHNINTTEVNSFTVGALNGNSSSLQITDFSSRGPSNCGGTGSILIKPEVSAPGFQVRSCDPGGEYAFRSGTSMASPHVAGAILLLREAFPNLTAEAIKLALYNTARDLGLPGEDNTYGTGIIDVYEAYLYLVDQGFDPASPERDLDALVYKTDLWPIECNNEVSAYVSALNDGSDTIYSARIFYRVVGAVVTSNEYIWQGEWIPGDRITVTLPSISSLQSGEYDLFVDVQQLNGRNDDRPLNNRMRTKVLVSDLLPESPSRLTLDDSDLCKGSTALLGIDLANGAEVSWYDNPSGINAIHKGLPFRTQEIQEPVSYYSVINYGEKIGLADQSSGDVIADGGREGSIIFDVYSTLTLESVRVFAEQAGGRIISLYQSNGEVLSQELISLDSPGEHVIDLGFEIPPGDNYRLTLKAGRTLSLNSDGASYPYEVPSVLRIKRGNHPDWPNNVWPYFYDWRIRYDDPCGPQEIRLNPDQSRTTADASYEIAPDMPEIDELIQFIDKTQFATNWLWDFGDGNTSAEQNPYYVYQDTGVYNSSLWIVDEENCSDYSEVAIVVTDEITTSLETTGALSKMYRIFPNPASNFIEVGAVGTGNLVEATVVVSNISGKIMYRRVADLQKGESLIIPVENWPQGAYIINIDEEGGSFSGRILKME